MAQCPALNHPTSGTANPVTLTDNDDALRTAVNAIDADNITAASVTDACLTSPNNGVFRLIHQTRTAVPGSLATGSVYMFQDVSAAAIASGTTTASPHGLSLLHIYGTHHTVNGKTPRLRTRVLLGANATAPAVNVVVGLYPVTVAGASGNMTFTLGTVVSGSTVTFTTPSASAFVIGVGADFAFPVDGAYILGYTVSGTTAAASMLHMTGYVETRAT